MIVEQANLNGDAIDTIAVDYPKGSYDHSALTNPQGPADNAVQHGVSLALTVIKRKNTPRESRMDALPRSKDEGIGAKVSLRKMPTQPYFEDATCLRA